jgi:hypothetical protein
VLRRLATLALLAAGLMPVCQLAGTPPVAAAPHPSAASNTICVALVVDAHSIGGPVSTDCATVKKGSTGIDVLEAAGHTVTFRSDGLLCTIDGLPRTGCSAVDDTHYWAYYHRAPGSTTWSYSNEGAGTYQPVNDSTDGWVYDNGTKLTPRNVPYAAICKPTATPSPTARATRAHRSTLPVTPKRRSTSPPAPTSSDAAGSSHRAHHRPTSPRANNPTPTRSATPLRAEGRGRSTTPLATGPDSSSGGHGTLVGVIVAAVIVAGLAGAAAANTRRRRS